MKRRLLWQIFPAFVIITVLGLFLIFWNVSGLMKDFYYQEKRTQLEKLANLSIPSFPLLIENAQYEQIQALCMQMGRTTQTRFTVIDLQGKVLGDSQEQPEKMVNHFDRPEFQTALTGQTGSDIRPSETLRQEMMYVAIPIQKEGDRHCRTPNIGCHDPPAGDTPFRIHGGSALWPHYSAGSGGVKPGI